MSAEEFEAIMKSGMDRARYQPPSHLGMKMTDFVGAYVVLLCSFEALAFAAFLKTHPAHPHHTLRVILPGYTVTQWADGVFSEEILAARTDAGLDLEALRVWAATLIAFDAVFQRLGVREPIGWLKNQGFIKESAGGVGWTAVRPWPPPPKTAP